MRRQMRSFALVAMAAFALAGAPAAADGPSVGEPAPPFTLLGSDGNSYSLDDFVGKRGVVLAWFPRAFTGG